MVVEWRGHAGELVTEPSSNDVITEHFDCYCYSPEHTIRFSLNPEDNRIYAETFLHLKMNLFQRIVAAVKYIFGHRSQFGHFECFVLIPSDVHRLKTLLGKIEQ